MTSIKAIYDAMCSKWHFKFKFVLFLLVMIVQQYVPTLDTYLTQVSIFITKRIKLIGLHWSELLKLVF